MRVQDVMSRGIRTVSPSTPAEDAWTLMRMKEIHHLVVTEGKSLAGILSDRDAGGRRGAALRKDRTVDDLMTREVVTVPPETPLRKAANLMRGRSIGCLVVVDDHRAVGIITVADLLSLIGRGSERPVAKTKRWTLKHRTPHRKKTHPTGMW